jgi:nitrogen fixation/metabolism regulation signal transduction histidine kinase
MERRIRGSGLRHTLPFIVRFAGLWLVVSIAAVLVAAVSSYLLFAQRQDGSGDGLRGAIVLQTVLSVLALVALAVFTTHRIAGPWVAVRRALLAVRDGNLDSRLRFRVSDPRLREVEEAFDEMTATLRQRSGQQAGIVAEALPPGAARPVAAPPT